MGNPFAQNRVSVPDGVIPMRFHRGNKASLDETIEAMLKAAKRFDTTKIQLGDRAAVSGPPVEE